MDTYTLHLATAALIGASFVAVSAYYIHCKTVLNQLLEFAKTVDREDAEDRLGRGDSPHHFKQYADKRRSHGRRKVNGYYRRSSAKSPDVMAISGSVEANGRRYGQDRIPAGLPALQTTPEGMNMSDFSPE